GFAGHCNLIQPLEVWTYSYLPDLGHNVRLIFYEPRRDVDFRLWTLLGKSKEDIAELISSQVMALVQEDEALAIQRVFGLSTNPLCRQNLLTELECKCLDGAEILKLIQGAPVTQPAPQNIFKPPAVNPEDVRRILRSVVLANPSAAKLPAEFSVAYPAR